MLRRTANRVFNPARWQAVKSLGLQVDDCIAKEGLDLTLGGEPTFVAADHPDLPEWQTAPLGDDKRRRARRLLLRLRRLWIPETPVQFAVGKSYPGEDRPRWSFGCFWRRDGQPLWSEKRLLATGLDPSPASPRKALHFLRELTRQLNIDPECCRPLGDKDGRIAGYALPLLRTGKSAPRWNTCRWQGPWGPAIPLLPGTAPMGLRLPLDRLKVPVKNIPEEWQDPDDSLPFPTRTKISKKETSGSAIPPAPGNSIRVALCVQAARGLIRVFLPPIGAAASFIDLLNVVEKTARILNVPVRLEGYPPPFDPRLLQLTITPDPGVLEVNLPPQDSWPALVDTIEGLYREATACGLRPWKFLPDGRRVGSGGGSHFTLGAKNPKQSPWLRRPDLLRSFLAYWNNHPGLSHAFAGLFVGPTSQAPRLDQSRPNVLPDAEMALNRLGFGMNLSPEEVDALLRNFLTDLTGNAHRAEFCIDKLFPVDHADRKWGLVEWRGAEMVPSARHWLSLALLLRILMVHFWRKPYQEELIAWQDTLYDRFSLPFFIAGDLDRVVADLNRSGFAFEERWLKLFVDFRFPVLGCLKSSNAVVEIRQALEPWPVLGQAIAGDQPSRPVDCSCERLQVLLRSKEPDRFQIFCNGLLLPLAETGNPHLRVLGIRFKALNLPGALHPNLTPHHPLTFDLVDRSRERVVDRGRYFWGEPDGAPYSDPPGTVSAGRRRFQQRFQPLPLKETVLPPCRGQPPEPAVQKYTLDLLRIRREDMPA